MNRDLLLDRWAQMRGDVKSYFTYLTDTDLDQIEGDEDMILVKLQERYGYNREQAQAEWDKFSKKYGDVSHTDIRNTEKKGNKSKVTR